MSIRDKEALDVRLVAFEAMWNGSFDEAIEQYDRALALAESDEVRELITIGKAEALIAADREGTEVNALAAIVMRRRSPRHVYMAAAVLMRRYCETEDRRRAIFYGEIARDAATALQDSFARATVLNNLGITLTADSQFTAAIAAFDEALAALAVVAESNDRVVALRAAIVANLGGAKVLCGLHEDGIRLLESALPKLNETYELTEAYLDLCFGYMELGQDAKAEELGRKALAYATVGRQIRNANHLLGELALRAGRYAEADDYFTVVAGFYPQFPNVKELLVTVDLCAVVNWKG